MGWISPEGLLSRSVLTYQGGALAPPFFCVRAPARLDASYPVPRSVSALGCVQPNGFGLPPSTLIC